MRVGGCRTLMQARGRAKATKSARGRGKTGRCMCTASRARDQALSSPPHSHRSSRSRKTPHCPCAYASPTQNSNQQRLRLRLLEKGAGGSSCQSHWTLQGGCTAGQARSRSARLLLLELSLFPQDRLQTQKRNSLPLAPVAVGCQIALKTSTTSARVESSWGRWGRSTRLCTKAMVTVSESEAGHRGTFGGYASVIVIVGRAMQMRAPS